MVQMSRNMFSQKHDGQKNYRVWACLEGTNRIDVPFNGGGIELRRREIDF